VFWLKKSLLIDFPICYLFIYLFIYVLRNDSAVHVMLHAMLCDWRIMKLTLPARNRPWHNFRYSLRLTLPVSVSVCIGVCCERTTYIHTYIYTYIHIFHFTFAQSLNTNTMQKDFIKLGPRNLTFWRRCRVSNFLSSNICYICVSTLCA